VDALPADADVAAQMQHREKQLRLVLDQTIVRLTPAERTALDDAALLPPDSIPWPWLRALVEKEHPEEFAARAGYPDPWPALRRRLEGLRLLTPGDHVEIARLHRMVAAQLRERLAAGDGSEGQRPDPGRCSGLIWVWAFGPRGKRGAASYARDVVVSHFKLAQFGRRSGDAALTRKRNAVCHALMQRFISAGVTSDAPVMGLYRQLHSEFGGGR
jgi:hypothetical protein